MNRLEAHSVLQALKSVNECKIQVSVVTALSLTLFVLCTFVSPTALSQEQNEDDSEANSKANSEAMQTAPQPNQLNEDDSILEEVSVFGVETRLDDSEMTPATQKLFSVAGAASDPLQAIYAMPGITFSNGDGPGGTEPVIRGSAPQDNGYFIDRVPASYIFHIFGNSIFDKYLIHSFDLYPAAFPSEYGNATGGIIDVSLREPRNQDFTSIFHASFLSSGLMLESGLGDNHAFYASYRRSVIDQFVDEDDVVDEEENPGITIDRFPVSDDYQVKYRWNINDENSLSFIAAGASDVIAATFAEGNNLVARDPDFAGAAAISQGFDSQGLTWNLSLDNKDLTTIFTHINDKEDLTYGINQHQKTEAERYLFRTIYGQALGDKHHLTVGGSVEDIRYDLDFNAKIVPCSDFDADCPTIDAEYLALRDTLKVNTYEFFVDDQWHLNDTQSLTLGLRYGQDDYIKDGRWEPRIKWEYLVNSHIATHVSAGQYSQLPQLQEMVQLLGNPALTTVKADHYVWGLTQELSGSWRWNTDVYYKRLSDIVISSEADASAENYSNNAEGTAYGIEFLLNKKLTDRWYGWASLSLSETDRTNTLTRDTVKFEYDKPVLFNLIANRLIGEKWMIGFKWNFQSGARYTPITDVEPSRLDPTILTPVYGKLNSQRHPNYHRLDFRAEYTSPKDWGYWKFYIDILNAYDKENIEGYDYAPNGKDLVTPPAGFGEDIPVQEETGDGIFPSIGFEIKF